MLELLGSLDYNNSLFPLVSTSNFQNLQRSLVFAIGDKHGPDSETIGAGLKCFLNGAEKNHCYKGNHFLVYQNKVISKKKVII